ncbi:fumarylacetoacetate hydrolase family protein [Prosthecomicrobium hirschii]|uniref:fumarylacetoacetate hydrolase family protein n=1 Tax=Prosthecodimorpha hirschii TaxID=665126 RepID=UPI002220C582|nr:fumarylacetoacetate hydrolase family protein [Prosthecomicrobium hirschii]MCW1838870.1 fumarylacetoacetate hydrolase family protein [Prosthecomicrobium hirschii]
MRIARIQFEGSDRLAIDAGAGLRLVVDAGLPDDPLAILADPALSARAVAAATGPAIDEAAAAFRLPLAVPGRIFCVGLNYADHAKESPYEKPNYPVYFLRVDTGLIPHGAAIVRPLVSTHLDFEGEIAAVIGTGGRNIPMDTALDHVAAYTIFNDGSIRDYQFKGPQWTLGKNFDETGPLGPWLVPAADLPPGIKGLRLQTRLNGQVVQEANTDDLLFPVAEVIARLSEAVTLKPGDVIATGTPAGVGFARKPPLFMKHGDVVEIEVEGIGILRNPVRDEVR